MEDGVEREEAQLPGVAQLRSAAMMAVRLSRDGGLGMMTTRTSAFALVVVRPLYHGAALGRLCM